MNFIRHKPLHSFLIGLYIISFIFVRNFEQVRLPMVYRSVVVSLIVAALLFGASYAVYRSSRKAGIFTTLLLTGFFIYGFIYEQLEFLFYQGHWPFSHIHRFLIFGYGLFYLVVFMFLYRSKRPHYHVNYVLNVFVLTLFFLNALLATVVAQKHRKGYHISNPFIPANPSAFVSDSAIASPAPDVYYIILDGYASEATLKDFYEDSMPILYNYLRKKGFYIADSSHSNYYVTAPSLSSSLNVNYLDSTFIKSSPVLIEQNLVSYVFRQNHYRVVHIQSGYAVTEQLTFADKKIPIAGLNEFENRMMELTLLRLDDVLGFTNYIRLRSELDRMKLVAQEPGPKFGFIHIVSPHPPFVVDSAGRRKIRNTLSDLAWEPRADYHGQLQFVSKKVMAFIDDVLQTSQTPPLIVLQSDHGPWINDPDADDVYDARTSILNAYYLPPAMKAKLYPGISPVNSFRVIFSGLFHLPFPLLTDRPVPPTLFTDPTFRKYAD